MYWSYSKITCPNISRYRSCDLPTKTREKHCMFKRFDDITSGNGLLLESCILPLMMTTMPYLLCFYIEYYKNRHVIIIKQVSF